MILFLLFSLFGPPSKTVGCPTFDQLPKAERLLVWPEMVEDKCKCFRIGVTPNSPILRMKEYDCVETDGHGNPK